MKHPIRPMLCGSRPAPLGDEAFVSKPGMAYELKYDGHRLIAIKAGQTVSLYYRSGNWCTDQFPEVVASLRQSDADFVLDGEIVILRDGWPNFNDLQNRGGWSAERRAADLRFAVFDVLQIGSLETVDHPYTARRQALEAIVKTVGPAVTLGPSTTDGVALWKIVRERKLEGLIEKPLTSTYRFGERGQWIKIKRYVLEDFTIVAWHPGIGSRLGGIGSLFVAEPASDGQLEIVGVVGTGFPGAIAAELVQELGRLAIPKEDVDPRLRKGAGRDQPLWVRPELRCTVAYPERSGGSDGTGVLKMASFQGLVR